ncbi:MAG: histidinol dehydrogenase [Eubacteriales bacterium]
MKYLKNSVKKTEAQALELTDSVATIIRRVRTEGDCAIVDMNTQFDNNPSTKFQVERAEIQAAYDSLTAQELADLQTAHSYIEAFAKAQKDCVKPLENFSNVAGSSLGHRVIPIRAALCYVPGGGYPLFSSALMLVTPAKVAGVNRVVACSPADKQTGRINPKTLVAMDLAGADEIYAMGGAHAVAAFSYGTEQIKPVDIIVGPGNRFVTEAKRQCFGQVGIDFVAGPSEVLMIADETANPGILAADILAQSEHDPNARGILLTTDEAVGLATIAAVEEQLSTLSTSNIAEIAWKNNGEVILVDTLEEAADLCNDCAPEHLELVTKDNDRLKDMVYNYGSLFLGQDTGEVFGDYASGTNHTLPTLRAARYTGGVWVGTFQKVCTHQQYNVDAMKTIAPLVARMARGEGLEGHARAADIRQEQMAPKL